MASVGSETRAEKVQQIFEKFDRNGDGGLNREEMAALVVAVNPRVKFSDDQIAAILDEVFRTYADFIEPRRGLTLEGLIRTYDDGAGDVDRDFDALSLNGGEITAAGGGGSVELGTSAAPIMVGASSSSLFDDQLLSASASKPAPAPSKAVAARWATSPNHGILFDSSWALLEDLEILIKRLRSKQLRKVGVSRNTNGKEENNSNNNNNNFDSFSEAGWSRDTSGPYDSSSSLNQIAWDETSRDYLTFVKELAVLRGRADAARAREEALDNHMAMGRSLYEHQLYRDSLVSFRRACELAPTDVKAHFRQGNSLYALGRHAEAKEEFLLALEAAEAGGSHSSDILPQIHVNLGISFESEGMILNACEHYREAAILNPSHFRALKLLGSALFGVGEYRAAEKALEEAIYLRPDYADAHCDLGSTLHAMGEDDRAIQEFQKAIDLKPGHVDSLYNLGGLYMDKERFARAAEMYTRVLSVTPGNWKAQLNRAVALIGQGESDEGKKALKEAFKMTKRVELYDAISHLKALQKNRNKKSKNKEEADPGFVIVEDPSKFKRVGVRTTLRKDLANALEIRAFQRLTRLNKCEVDLVLKQMNETDVPISYSGTGVPEKSIRKAALELILRRLLNFLKPETFQGSIKAINERVLSVLDASGSGRVDLGMFLAMLAPICSGPVEKRKRAVFDALLWRPVHEPGATEIRRSDALTYIKLLRAVYIPSNSISEMLEMHGESDPTMVPYHEFLDMFNDSDWGFGVLTTLVKLEEGDRIRHGRFTCSMCRYPIVGSRFKETKHRFSLCNKCYSQGKVPSVYNLEEYSFKEYGKESDALRDKCLCFNLNSKESNVDT
ncbi:hypothetical protein LUZ60_008893 [Juncus effusus]|nr:hypothetical protein LUZ60_008893 [Juncus effusus]